MHIKAENVCECNCPHYFKCQQGNALLTQIQTGVCKGHNEFHMLQLEIVLNLFQLQTCVSMPRTIWLCVSFTLVENFVSFTLSLICIIHVYRYLKVVLSPKKGGKVECSCEWYKCKKFYSFFMCIGQKMLFSPLFTFKFFPKHTRQFYYCISWKIFQINFFSPCNLQFYESHNLQEECMIYKHFFITKIGLQNYF